MHRNNVRLSLCFPAHSHIEYLSNKLWLKIVITKRIWRKIENISITSINRALEVECMQNVLIFRYFLFSFQILIGWLYAWIFRKVVEGVNFLELNFWLSSSFKFFFLGIIELWYMQPLYWFIFGTLLRSVVRVWIFFSKNSRKLKSFSVGVKKSPKPLLATHLILLNVIKIMLYVSLGVPFLLFRRFLMMYNQTCFENKQKSRRPTEY